MKQLSTFATTLVPSATVGIADTALEMRRSGIDVVDLSAGRASEATPDYVCNAAIVALQNGDTHQTHGQGTKSYREACAAYLKREYGFVADPDKEILATMGVKQGLTAAFNTLLNPGDEVIIEDPCFVSYTPLINMTGGVAVPLPLLQANLFRWTAEQLEEAITPRTKAILMSSPQNPTGTVHTMEDCKIIADAAIRHDLIVLCDEVYENVTWGKRKHLLIQSLPNMRERTWSLHGLTKTFAMGGWRIGFIQAPADHLQRMVDLQRHLITSCNSFVQAGAAVAFGTPVPDIVKSMWVEWESRCALFTKSIDGVGGVRCPMPEGGFYAWADIASLGGDDLATADLLLRKYHVAVVPGSAFGAHGKGFLRFTCVRSRQDLAKAIDRVRACFESLSGSGALGA